MMSFQVYSDFQRQNTQAVFLKAMAAAPAVPMSLGTPVATILGGPTSNVSKFSSRMEEILHHQVYLKPCT